MERVAQLKSSLDNITYYKYKSYYQSLCERMLLLGMPFPKITYDDNLNNICLRNYNGLVFNNVIQIPEGITVVDVPYYANGCSYIDSIKLPGTVEIIASLGLLKIKFLDTHMVKYYLSDDKCFIPCIVNCVIRENFKLDFNKMKVFEYTNLIFSRENPYSLKKCHLLDKDKQNIGKSNIFIDDKCIKYGETVSKYVICSEKYDVSQMINIGWCGVLANSTTLSIDEVINDIKAEVIPGGGDRDVVCS